MAKDLFDTYDSVKTLFGTAKEILEFDLADACFNGPEDLLKQTNITQPAIFTHSVALSNLLKEKKYVADMVAGHSLGEYSALYFASVFSFEDGLRLVKVRGDLMQKAGEISEGTMAAIMGLSSDVLNELCEEASVAGVVRVANFNSPIQTVISGAVSGVEKAMEIAKQKGAKRVVPLVVGGAFHSPLMEFAIEGLSEALESANLTDAAVPVYSNVTAAPVTKASEIKELLLKQLTSPVNWTTGISNMISDGAKSFWEVGPGTVLTGLLKRINRDIASKNINSQESVDTLDNE